MSLNRYYKIPIADIPAELPQQSVYGGTDSTNNAYWVGEAAFADWDALPNTSIVGSWDSVTSLQEGQSYAPFPTVIGTPTHPVTVDYTAWIRPLGNEAGRATGLLDSVRWQGQAEAKFLQDGNRYADSNAPFTLKFFREDVGGGATPYDTDNAYPTGSFVTHIGSTWEAAQDVPAAPAWDNGTTYNTDDYVERNTSTYRSSSDGNVGNDPLFGGPWVLENITPFGGSPYWTLISDPGWYWVCVMISDDPLRDINARAIWVYTDDTFTAFSYQTGAFVQDGSYENQFYTRCPPGQQTINPDPVYLELREASNPPEGQFVLELDEGEALFWAADQP